MSKQLILAENGKGNFDINCFGTHIAGSDGADIFDLIVRSSDLVVDLHLRNVKISDVFTRLDVKGKDFQAGTYHTTDFIEVARGKKLVCLIVTKTLFSLFKSALRDHRLQIRSEMPISLTDGTNFQKYQKTIGKSKAA